jgi:hypothetical protein
VEGFLCLLLKRERDFTPIGRHNFPHTLEEIREIFMDTRCPPNILRKFIQALHMREVRDKKRQRKVLLVGKQPISYTHLCSLLVGGNVIVHLVGTFLLVPHNKRGGGVKTWVGNFVAGQKNK